MAHIKTRLSKTFTLRATCARPDTLFIEECQAVGWRGSMYASQKKQLNSTPTNIGVLQMNKYAFRCLKLGGATAVFAIAQAAFALPLTLTGVTDSSLGPQSTSNPCIIAATTCQQPAGMGYNNFTSSGNISSYNMYSTTPTATVADGVQGTPYTVGQINSVLGSKAFGVAIDVNTTNDAGEILNLFDVIVNGSVLYHYAGGDNIGSISNNGNGFGDWLLGDIDLSGFADTATVLFHANWDHASDGGESFFLVKNTPTSVTEPGSLGLLAAGILGLAAARRFICKA